MDERSPQSPGGSERVRSATASAADGLKPMRSANLRVAEVERKVVMRLKAWDVQKPAVLNGETLPTDVGAILPGSIRLLCLGPGDWFLVSNATEVSFLRERIEPELSAQGLSLVDLSEAYLAIQVRGPLAAELLSKGCGLDFHAREFPAGRCKRTRLAQIPVLIECLEVEQSYELTVARSYTQYLSAWLADAMIELG